MIRFIFKIILFWVLLLLVIYGAAKIYSIPAESKNYKNFKIEENLVITPQKDTVDYLFMGLSHARNFSRHRNHQRIEKILDIDFINYGKGGGKGDCASQYNYLKYFLSERNYTENILYVLSMPMFFANRLDENAFTYQYEVLKPDFFYQILAGPDINKGEKLYNYVRTKFDKKWREDYGPWSAKEQSKVLEEFDTTEIVAGFERAYVNGLEFDAFERNKELIEETILLAKEEGINISFLISPSTFGEWPGHKHVIDFLEKMHRKYGVKTYDYSNVYLHQKKYFYDHHHLNTKGVVKFTKEYLKPLVNNQKDKNPG